MAEKQWYVCINNEVFGPLDAGAVQVMLQQSRVQFMDFMWREGMSKWTRISEVVQFASLIPGYPKAPLPKSEVPVKPSLPPPTPIPIATKERSVTAAKIRGHQRVMVNGVVSFEDKQLKLVDLSLAGMFVASDRLIPIGTETKFRLAIEGVSKTFDMTGMVVRHGTVVGKLGFAIEFIRVNPAHLRALGEIVESHQTGQAG